MKVKRMIKSDVDTFKVGDIIKVKLTDGVKVQAMAMQQEEDGMIFCLVDCLPGEYPMNSTRKDELIGKLAEMYNDPIVTLMEEPDEKAVKNVNWETNW